MQSAESSDTTSEVKAPETTEPTVSAEPPVPVDPTDVNAKTLTQLNTLMEESLQIYELEDQKVTVILDKTDENNLFKDLSENKNLNIQKLEQASKFVNKADFYLENLFILVLEFIKFMFHNSSSEIF